MRRCSSLLAIALLGACSRSPDRLERVEQAHYVGAARCGECHDAAHAFWNNTPHARAFFTLAKLDKTGDRACITCHVTGFEEPGGHRGSAPTGLEAVQCEVCHGPGSRHAHTESLAAIQRKPPRSLCATCHRPPQVPDGWSLEAAWPKIIGPGHGEAL
jgi:hypothetical protein